MDIQQILSIPGVAIFILVWSLLWKGLALWKAAGKKHLWWYIRVI